MQVISMAKEKDKDLAEMGRLLLTIVFILSVLNLTGTHLHTPPGDIFFWFSLGCISRYYRQLRDESRAAAESAAKESAVPDAAQLPATPHPGSPGHRFPMPGGARA
jgi:hypothetical protein